MAVGGIVSGVRPLWDEMPLTGRRIVPGGTGEGFSDVLDRALAAASSDTGRGDLLSGLGGVVGTVVSAVRETDAQRVRLEYLSATGQLDDPSRLSIAEAKEQIAVDLLIQLRNRALEAYNELIRISL